MATLTQPVPVSSEGIPRPNIASADVQLPAAAGSGGQILLACAPEDVERLGTKGLERIGTVR